MSDERTVRVSSDTRLSEAEPNRKKGDAKQLWVREGAGTDEVSLLWAKTPWRDDKPVFVQSQILRLTVAADSTATGDLNVRALSKRFSETNEKWNGKPGTTGATATQAVGALSKGDTVDIDITAIGQAIAAGGRNKGIQLSTTATSRLRFYASEHKDGPKIITTWSDEPSAPRIVPSGLISKQFPIFGFDYAVANGDLTAVRLQIDAATPPDSVSPDFDSGLVSSTEALFDTAGTLYAGLADGASTWVRGSIVVSGIESPMSEWVQVTRAVKGTLTADSPTNGGTVTSPTPTMLATFTPPLGGEALTQQRVRVYNAARTKVLYNSGRQPSADADTIAADVPFRWKGKRVLAATADSWSVLFEGWGNPERVDGPDDPAHVSAWADFTLTSGAPSAPTGLTAGTVEGLPWADLAFTIGPDAPDEILIAVDDKIVATLQPADLHVGGTSYAYRLAALPPFQDAAVKVAKVVAGVMSPWTAAATVRTRPHGVWIVDLATGDAFKLQGLDVGDLRFTDQATYYDPLGAHQQIRVVTAQQGMSGAIRGNLRANDALTYDEQVAAVWRIKARPLELVQMVTTDWSLSGLLDDLSPGPHADYFEGQPVRSVSIGRFRSDERPWED